MLVANEYAEYNGYLFVFFSDLFLYFITEVTCLEREMERCSKDEESSPKVL